MHNFETEERLLPVLRHTGFTRFTVFTLHSVHTEVVSWHAKKPFRQNLLVPFLPRFFRTNFWLCKSRLLALL